MIGEFNFQKFGTFLKSFWGLLASITVILPTIIYFLNASQIKSSILNDFYIGIPTTFALLTIPLIFLFEDKLSVLNSARKTAFLFFGLSLLVLFTFLVIKNIFIGDRVYSKSDSYGNTRTEISEKKDGQILIQTFDTLHSDPIKQERRTNALEMFSLFLYTLTIIFLTASFSALGVFFYAKSKAE